MYRWWKCGRLFFCGHITSWAISRDILRGPRLFWSLNCPERSEGQFRGQPRKTTSLCNPLVLLLLYDFINVKNDVKYIQKVISNKTWRKNESRIRIRKSEVGIRGSGTVPKYHGSGILTGITYKMLKTLSNGYFRFIFVYFLIKSTDERNLNLL